MSHSSPISTAAYDYADRYQGTKREPVDWWLIVAEYHHSKGQWTEAAVAVSIAQAHLAKSEKR